jgi:hypothetical protein
VDDCKISHQSTKVVDDTIEWLRDEFEVIFKDSTGKNEGVLRQGA